MKPNNLRLQCPTCHSLLLLNRTHCPECNTPLHNAPVIIPPTITTRPRRLPILTGPALGLALAIITTLANLARGFPLAEALTIGLVTGLLWGTIATILINPGRPSVPPLAGALLVLLALAACITLYIIIGSAK